MRIRHLLFTFIGLLICSVSQFTMASDARTVYEQGALKHQIAAIGPQIRDAFDATLDITADQLSDDSSLRDRIRLTIDSAFSLEAGEAAMLLELDAQLTDNDRNRVIDWLETPLGARILKAEHDATFSSLDEFDDFIAQRSELPEDTKRLTVLRELDTALGSTEAGAKLLMQLDVAIALAHRGAIDADPTQSQGATGIEIPGLPEYTSAIENHVLQHHLFAYQSLSNRDLKRYISFATSLSGARYLLAVQRGLERAISSGTWKLAELLMRWHNTPRLLQAQFSP